MGGQCTARPGPHHTATPPSASAAAGSTAARCRAGSARVDGSMSDPTPERIPVVIRLILMPTESTSSESLATVLNFQRQTAELVADEVLEIPEGWVVRTPSL